MLTNKLFTSCYLIFIYIIFNAILFCQHFSKINMLLTYQYLILFIFVVLLCSSSMSADPSIILISHCTSLQENYRMGGSFVWPTVAEVAEYRKKVRKAILDVIDNTPLELPVTQESKWVR